MRGAGGVPITSPRLFSARRGAVDDVALAVRHVRAARGGAGAAGAVLAVSWSNGGTVVNNYVAEQGQQRAARPAAPRIDGAVTINTPLSFRHCAAALASTPFHRWAYDFLIARELVSCLRPARAVFAATRGAVPTLGGGTCWLDFEAVLRCTTVGCLDATMTHRVFDHASVLEYYRTASSDQRLGDVRVPLLMCQVRAILWIGAAVGGGGVLAFVRTPARLSTRTTRVCQALDDPIATRAGVFAKAASAARENENLVLVCTEGGGHLGYQDNSASHRSDAEGRWIERVVAGFLDVARDEAANNAREAKA